MTEAYIDAIKCAVFKVIGVKVSARIDNSQPRRSLLVWFENYSRQGGALFSIRPTGLSRHIVSMSFGVYAQECIEHINTNASDEQYATARGLLKNLAENYKVSLEEDENIDEWKASLGSLIEIEVKDVDAQNDEEYIKSSVIKVMVPLMAMVAELIGYTEEEPASEDEIVGLEEGDVLLATVKRRERNPRNRILCLSIHGERCGICGMDPKLKYGEEFGRILEVHHIHPLSKSNGPMVYNPSTDLIPLCPNCHRAVHRSDPPLPPEYLKKMID
jgi:5-methylcytosine-specific restriction protein A